MAHGTMFRLCRAQLGVYHSLGTYQAQLNIGFGRVGFVGKTQVDMTNLPLAQVADPPVTRGFQPSGKVQAPVAERLA